jgi:hypothetical protein
MRRDRRQGELKRMAAIEKRGGCEMFTKFKAVALVLVLLASFAPAASAQPSNQSAQEKTNLKLVLDWFREVIQAYHLELAPKYMAEGYIQHNPNISRGAKDSLSS